MQRGDLLQLIRHRGPARGGGRRRCLLRRRGVLLLIRRRALLLLLKLILNLFLNFMHIITLMMSTTMIL